MERLLSKIWDYAVHGQELPMRRRLYLLTTLVTGLLCLCVVIPSNLFQALPFMLNLVVFVFGIFSLFMYREARRGRDHVTFFFLLLILMLDLSWFPNAGSAGSIIYFFFTAVIYPMALYRGNKRWAMTLLLAMNVGSLLLLEHMFPSAATPFNSELSRLVDLLTGTFCSILASSLILWVVVTNYDREQERTAKYAQDLAVSEKKYRELVETANSVILTWDRHGTIGFINEFGERLFGYSKNELIGRNIVGTIVPPVESSGRDLEQLMQEISRMPDRFKENENENMTRDGGRVWLHWGNRSILNESGETTGVLSIGNDITERRRSEAELQKRNQYIETILENAPIGFAVRTTEDGVARFVSSKFERIYGLSRGTLTSFDAFFEAVFRDPVFREKFRRQVAADISSGDPARWVWENVPVRMPSGGVRYVTAMDIPVPEQNLLVSTVQDVTERIQAEEALRHREEQYHALFENMHSGFILMEVICDSSGQPVDHRLLQANREFEAMTGLKRNDEIGRTSAELSFSWPREVASRYYDIAINGGTLHWERFNESLKRYYDIRAFCPTRGQWAMLFNDITEKKTLEAQLLQSQKMEAIGTLAGGVAHDFNNILTAIIGYGDLLKMSMAPDDQYQEHINQILASADRAAQLTRALLAFSRKQVIQPKPTDLNEIVKSVKKLLMRLIGEDIELSIELARQPLIAMADAGQIEQVLLNLVTNARDAQPNGGKIAIASQAVRLDEEFVRSQGIEKPGSYVQVTVSDSGVGMDEHTREKIFEPFFTTKESGKGTGLGLSIVYGIIKQHNGGLLVHSEPGKGTAFTIYLPLIPRALEDAGPVTDVIAPRGGTETILYAEDDPSVRALVSSVLGNFGYRVITAVDGQDALAKFRHHDGEIALLLLDVIMPRKNGKEVYDSIRAVRPGIRTLFMSGYTDDILMQKGIVDDGIQLIMKPAKSADLLRRVRAVLDADLA